jgi:hypothetical protein
MQKFTFRNYDKTHCANYASTNCSIVSLDAVAGILVVVLIDLASGPNCWIISSGSNSSLSKYFFRANDLKEYLKAGFSGSALKSAL